MQKLFFIFLCSCLITNLVYGQTTLTTSPKTLSANKSAQLDAQLGTNRYQAYSFNAQGLINQARNGVSTLNFTLSIGQMNFPILVSEHTGILSDDFSIISHEHGQAQDITSNVLIKNYRGTLQNDLSVPVSVTVYDLGIYVTLGLATGDMTFTPTFVPLLGEYEEDEYVFHEDPASPYNHDCDVGNFFSPFNNCTPPGGLPFDQTIIENDCPRLLEIAADADELFLENFPQGIIGQIIAPIIMFITIQSGEQVYLNEFDLGFQVTNIRLFWDNDPYPNGNLTDAIFRSDLINSVSNEYIGIPQNTIRRDLALLFTGNNCFNAADLPVSWGRASDTPDLCNMGAAAYVTECMYIDGSFPTVIAHEIGHLLGASHANIVSCGGDCNLGAGNNSLMCSGAPEGDPLFMDACAIADIDEFITTSAGCLNQDAEIIGPTLLCPGQTAVYFLVSDNPQMLNPTWSVSPGLTIAIAAGNTVSVTASNSFSGLAWVRAEVDGSGFTGGCDPKFRRNIAIKGLPATCPMIYRVCPGNVLSRFKLQSPAGWNISTPNCISANCDDISWSISGSGSERTFSVSEGDPGFYFFSYSVTNSCGTSSYTFTVEVLAPANCPAPIEKTDTQENERELNLEIVPNPNKGNFTLHYTLPDQAQPDISILDLQGIKVYELIGTGPQEPGQYSADFNLEHLPSGIYMVNIRTATDQRTIKLSIQH